MAQIGETTTAVAVSYRAADHAAEQLPYRYRAVAAPLYSYLERTEGKGVISVLIIELFRARTEYVCALAKVKGCKLTAWGWIARALVASICFFPALWYLAFERKNLVMEYN